MSSSKEQQRPKEIISTLKSLIDKWMNIGISIRVGNTDVPPINPHYLSFIFKEGTIFSREIINGSIFGSDIDEDYFNGYNCRVLMGDALQGYGESRVADTDLSELIENWKIDGYLDVALKQAFHNYTKCIGVNVLFKNHSIDFTKLSEEAIDKYLVEFKKPKFDDFSSTDLLLDWSNELSKLSFIKDASAIIANSYKNNFFVDSEGREIAMQNIFNRLVYQFEVWHKSNIGIDFLDSFLLNPKISKQELESKLQESFSIAESLRTADTILTGDYPVIWDHTTTGTTAHEAFAAHLISAKYLMNGASTIYEDKLNKKILPDFFTIIDDPTLINGYGSFLYDDEGIKAKKIVLVENGILKNYLYDRASAKYFGKHSNGKSRMQGVTIEDENGKDSVNNPEPRVTNLEILSSNKIPDEQVFETMKKYCKDHHKEFGIYIEAGNGHVIPITGEVRIFPQRGWKIYPDGRKKEITNFFFVGHQNILNKVQVTGDTYEIAYGHCGAESGYVPTQNKAPICFLPKLHLIAGKKTRLTKRLDE